MFDGSTQRHEVDTVPINCPHPSHLCTPLRGTQATLPARFIELTHSGGSHPGALSSCLCFKLPTLGSGQRSSVPDSQSLFTLHCHEEKVSFSFVTHTAPPAQSPNLQPPPQKQGICLLPNPTENLKGLRGRGYLILFIGVGATIKSHLELCRLDRTAGAIGHIFYTMMNINSFPECSFINTFGETPLF